MQRNGSIVNGHTCRASGGDCGGGDPSRGEPCAGGLAASPPSPSRRRDRHSAAPPSPSGRRFNINGEGVSVK